MDSEKETTTTDSSNTAASGRGSSKFSQTLRALRQGRPPIVLILIAFITSIAIVTGVTAWALTYKAAERSATTLAKALQDETLRRVILNANTVYDISETACEAHVRNWEKGFYKLETEDDVEYATQMMYSALDANRQYMTAQAFYTQPSIKNKFFGERNAGLWEQDAEGKTINVITRQREGNYTTYVLNDDGTETVRKRRYNLNWFNFPDRYYVLNSKFWEAYNTLDDKPVGIKSYIRTVRIKSGDVVLQSTDISLQRMVSDLKSSAALSPYRSMLFAIETGATPSDDIWMADSLGTPFLYWMSRVPKYSTRPLRVSETESLYMAEPWFNGSSVSPHVVGYDIVRDLYSYISRTANGSVTQLSDILNGETRVLEINGITYFFRVDLLLRPRTNLHQAYIMLVDRDHVMADLYASNKKAIGVIAGVVAAGVSLAVAFSLLLANSLYGITKDLNLLAKFKFQQVVKPTDKNGVVKQATFSRIDELYKIQKAFHQMTVNFATAVSQNRRFGEGTARRTTLGQAGPLASATMAEESQV
ncbi:hypothetical protein HDU86_001267 [Geranomyces michiganensis]|nr:hypothetical protein HDU86_001267 [Geranomyces michiganensis]